MEYIIFVMNYNSLQYADSSLGCGFDLGSRLFRLPKNPTVQHACMFAKHNIEITSAEWQEVRGLAASGLRSRDQRPVNADGRFVAFQITVSPTLR